MSTQTGTAVDVVEKFIAAYNSGDIPGILELSAENLHLEHHNRGVLLDSAQAFADLLGQFAGAFPDKHFENRRALHVAGDNTVIVEQTWVATAIADVPGWAATGETVRLDVSTRFTVENGVVTEYHDYG
jgi:ketosteroid isomerase-like protein